MGGRGRNLGTGGGGGERKAKFSKRQIQKHVDKQMKLLPPAARKALKDHGVKVKVLTRSERKKLFGDKYDDRTRGVYRDDLRTAFVFMEHFQRVGGKQDAGMTGLHEPGHGLDIAKGWISRSLKFIKAVEQDERNWKNLGLTPKQRADLKYMHYPAQHRRAEVFAEGVAVLVGEGRPKPAVSWIDSDLFRRAYPTALKVIVTEAFK